MVGTVRVRNDLVDQKNQFRQKFGARWSSGIDCDTLKEIKLDFAFGVDLSVPQWNWELGGPQGNG